MTRSRELALSKECEQKHLPQTVQNERALNRRNVSVWESRWENQKTVTDFLDAPLLEDLVVDAWRQGNLEGIYEIFDLTYNEILKSSDLIDWQENILYALELEIKPDEAIYGPILKVGYLDMTLRNAFYKDGKAIWFDQEWILEGIPAKYVLCRAIAQVYFAYPNLEEFCSMESLLERYEILPAYEAFRQLEAMFTELILDEKHLKASANFRGTSKMLCLENIKKLLG